MLVLPSAARKRLLDLLKASGGFIDALTLHLYKNDYAPNQATTLGDMTECDFTGYAAVALGAWGADIAEVGGDWGVAAPSMQFTGSGSAVGNQIFGYYLTAVVSSVVTLVAAERFEEGPFSILQSGDAIAVIARWTETGLASAIAQQL